MLVVDQLTYIIIHESDIIRLGIKEIIVGSTEHHVISIKTIDEIVDYKDVSDQVMVLISKSTEESQLHLLKKLLPKTCSLVVVIIIENALDKATDNEIHINDSQLLILDKISEIERQNFNKTQTSVDFNLSKRELEVLKQIVSGKSNKEIADSLCVSIHTIISHRKNITEKTGIKSTSGLTMYALFKNVIDLSEFDPRKLV